MYKIIIALIFTALLAVNLQATEPTEESVTKLYIATFNRAPDKAGLDYWLNDSNLELEEIATSFFDQDETQKRYPADTSTQSFIESIYANLFQRVPDSEGASYWKKDLESGAVSKSVFILAVVNGAKGDDATLLANKTEVGLKFVELDLNDVNKAKSIMQDITASREGVENALRELRTVVEVPDLSSLSKDEGSTTSNSSPSSKENSSSTTDSSTTSNSSSSAKEDSSSTDSSISSNSSSSAKEDSSSTDSSTSSNSSSSSKEDSSSTDSSTSSNSSKNDNIGSKSDDELLPTFR